MPWRISFFLPFSYLVGGFYFVLFNITRASCRIVKTGAENIRPDRHYIFCLWHTHWWPYFVVNARFDRPHVWINHPMWYMKPIHLALQWMGVQRIILGSQGEEGRAASDALAAELATGRYSTTISPDGPGGPDRCFRKGVLHVAKKSGLPIVVVRIHAKRSIVFNSWDHKNFPWPFTTIMVTYEPPVTVTEENFSSVAEVMPRLLSG
jgi:lysophospholipid acyltransferase (LPLAT)-like uncharacterized protein